MDNNLLISFSKTSKRNLAFCALLALVALISSSAACQSRIGNDEGTARNIVIVNAPVAGEVRRILAREGMSVSEGTPIVEISVRTETQSAPSQSQAEDPQARAARSVQSSQREIEAARAEVVRHEVEVQRLTTLVASGGAPQAQLDAERAEYERAQSRLQSAQAASQNAQSGFVAARQQQQQNLNQATAKPSERIVTANASSAGTISVISAQVGAQVAAGQPLATLRTDR